MYDVLGASSLLQAPATVPRGPHRETPLPCQRHLILSGSMAHNSAAA